jgi:hypothetical protein
LFARDFFPHRHREFRHRRLKVIQWNSIDQRVAFIAANLGILATTDGDQAPTAFNLCDGLMGTTTSTSM